MYNLRCSRNNQLPCPHRLEILIGIVLDGDSNTRCDSKPGLKIRYTDMFRGQLRQTNKTFHFQNRSKWRKNNAVLTLFRVLIKMGEPV